LAAELERPRAGLSCANLSALAKAMHSLVEPTAPDGTAAQNVEAPPRPDSDIDPAATAAGEVHQRADAAHARAQGAAAATSTTRHRAVDNLIATLAAQPPEVLELLERIDDLVFTAIGGDQRSLAELEVLWPTVVADLDHDLVEQSREQYLRCALSIWSECVDGQIKRPERAVSAIDVLCVLFEE
jgi:hypothetical protein